MGSTGIYDRRSISRNDTITGGASADTLTGGAGANLFNYASDAQTGVVATGVVDVITDFKNTGVAATTDTIELGGAAGVLNTNFLVGVGNITYALALAAANTDFTGAVTYSVQAVGTGTSFTAYLFSDTGTTGSATGAIQLGTTGQFGTAALALASISAAQIV